MCVAFACGGTGYDGTTFVGSADGNILRFMEQATDLSVKAHPLDGNEVAKVSLPPPPRFAAAWAMIPVQPRTYLQPSHWSKTCTA